MCGIAGILRVYDPGEPVPPPLASIPEAWLDILDDSIKHRGPDGRGRFRDRVIRREDGATVDVALVHRRLSILDHAGGHQPMVSVRKGAGVIAGKRASGPHATGGGWLLYEDPSDPALNAWAERLSESASQRAGSASGRPDARAAHDPMHRLESGATQGANNGDEDLIAVIFNGCIYNHRELRRELQAAGHVFTSDHSDTEVLVHGWREWGVHALSYARGMFAIAVWDRGAQNLILARDFAGEKPLYFSRPMLKKGGALIFASVPTAIEALSMAITSDEADAFRELALSRIRSLESQGARVGEPMFAEHHSAVLGVPVQRFDVPSFELELWKPRVESNAPRRRVVFEHWLRQGCAKGTPLARVSEVDKGYLVSSFNDERISSGSAFISHQYQNARMTQSRPFTADTVEQAIVASVESMIDADVPLGCFLSGGVDSGLIAAIAQRALARHGQRLRTFTVRMPAAEIDESEAAASTARHIGAEHSMLECAPDPAADLHHLITQLGLPFGDSSLLPTYWLCREARRHVTVALAGDGGDEMFAGYERYRGAMWLDRYAGWMKRLPLAAFPHGHQSSVRDRTRRMILASRYGGYERLLDVFDVTDMRNLTGESTRRQAYQQSYPNPHVQSGIPRWHDFQNYLVHDLLRKTDTASMSVALEVRLPYLAFDLARHALITPAAVVMPDGQRKGLLKQVARKYLPADIVDRPKQGFAIPIGEWFRSDYGGLRQMLLDHLLGPEPFGSDTLGINSMINMAFVKQMLREHDDAGSASIWPWKGRDHSQRLYMLLVLSVWAKWLGELGVSSGTGRVL